MIQRVMTMKGMTLLNDINTNLVNRVLIRFEERVNTKIAQVDELKQFNTLYFLNDKILN